MNKENIAEVVNILKRLKAEIEAEGLIATADELIERIEEIMENYRLTQHNDYD